MDLEPKTYRYREAIEKKEIVYDKAWNANKIFFNTKPITWTQIMKHHLNVYPMHYLKCMVINQKVQNIIMEKLRMVEWIILKKC